jgi:hypothetical protein
VVSSRALYRLFGLLAVLLWPNVILRAQQNLVTTSLGSQLPAPQELYFTPNLGQWLDENPSLAQAVIPGGAVFITNQGIRILTEAANNIERKHQIHHFRGKDTQFTLAYHVTQLDFLHAKTPTNVVFEEPAYWKENYFLGHESSRWKSVTPFQKVTLKNLYPGIDIAIYFHQQTLEFD